MIPVPSLSNWIIICNKRDMEFSLCTFCTRNLFTAVKNNRIFYGFHRIFHSKWMPSFATKNSRFFFLNSLNFISIKLAKRILPFCVIFTILKKYCNIEYGIWLISKINFKMKLRRINYQFCHCSGIFFFEKY